MSNTFASAAMSGGIMNQSQSYEYTSAPRPVTQRPRYRPNPSAGDAATNGGAAGGDDV